MGRGIPTCGLQAPDETQTDADVQSVSSLFSWGGGASIDSRLCPLSNCPTKVQLYKMSLECLRRWKTSQHIQCMDFCTWMNRSKEWTAVSTEMLRIMDFFELLKILFRFVIFNGTNIFLPQVSKKYKRFMSWSDDYYVYVIFKHQRWLSGPDSFQAGSRQLQRHNHSRTLISFWRQGRINWFNSD